MEAEKHSNRKPSIDEDDRPEIFRDNGKNSGTRRSYDCTFCKRGFTNAQALGGHMNIHRKDKLAKAKEQNSKEPPLTSNFKARYFSTTSSSEVPHHDDDNEAIRARNNYQVYNIPPLNPCYQPSILHKDHGNNLALGLNLFTHVEYGGRRIENEDDNEVDLELRLGQRP